MKVFFFVLLLSFVCGPIFGTVLKFFFEFFCIRVAETQCFGLNAALWLMATRRVTREPLLSEVGFEKVFREAGFEKVFRTQNWVRRSKLFCR